MSIHYTDSVKASDWDSIGTALDAVNAANRRRDAAVAETVTLRARLEAAERRIRELGDLEHGYLAMSEAGDVVARADHEVTAGELGGLHDVRVLASEILSTH